jgi:hypothetical protein
MISIIVLVIFAWQFSYRSIEKSTSTLTKDLETLSMKVREENWQDAQDYFINIEDTWEETKKLWIVLLEGQQIDEIELSLIRTKEYLASENLSLTLGEIAVTKQLLNAIKESEALTITNVL